jgi:hypothetical protein
MFLNGDEVFECTLYYLHIAARKLETVNSIFSKYRILETERELIRFGLGEILEVVVGVNVLRLLTQDQRSNGVHRMGHQEAFWSISALC